MSTDEKEPKLTATEEDKTTEEKKQEILLRFKEREEKMKRLKEELELKEEAKKQDFIVSDKRKLSQPEEKVEVKVMAPRPGIRFGTPQSGPKPNPPGYDKPKTQRIPFSDVILRKEIEKEATRESNSGELRCKSCKYSGTIENFFFNSQTSTVVCPRCGNVFMSAGARIRIMERIRQNASGIIVPDIKVGGK